MAKPRTAQRGLVLTAALASVTACSDAPTPQADRGSAVYIPGATYTMGTDAAAIDALKSTYAVDWPGVFANEAPAQDLTLDGFWLDAHEVTNAAYAGFAAANPEWIKGALPPAQHNGSYLAHWSDDGPLPEDSNRPVVNVTWSAALAYCSWRGGRLPTEAEWEYAARSGDSREFPWGDELPTPERANYSASDHGAAVDVGSYPPNDLGLYDLAGNVWEFLADDWNERYRPPVEGIGNQVPEPTSRRSVRGASYGGSVVNLRTRWRDSHVVSNAIEFVGFRCAYDS